MTDKATGQTLRTNRLPKSSETSETSEVSRVGFHGPFASEARLTRSA